MTNQLQQHYDKTKKHDMVEAICDKLLEDHMALMAECESLRKENDQLKQNICDMHEYMHRRIEASLAEVGGSETATPNV